MNLTHNWNVQQKTSEMVPGVEAFVLWGKAEESRLVQAGEEKALVGL